MKVVVILFLCTVTIILGLSHHGQGHRAKRPGIGRAEVKDDKKDGKPKNDNAADVDGMEDDLPENGNDKGLNVQVLSKFEKLLTNVTKSMGDGKAITDDVYMEWGKSLEKIIEMGNKTMSILPETKLTNADGEEISIPDEGKEDSADDAAKDKKEVARRRRNRRNRKRM